MDWLDYTWIGNPYKLIKSWRYEQRNKKNRQRNKTSNLHNFTLKKETNMDWYKSREGVINVWTQKRKNNSLVTSITMSKSKELKAVINRQPLFSLINIVPENTDRKILTVR